MSRVDQLKFEIEALAPEDFAELRNWIADRDWERWDRQLERDVKAGKLEFLREEAVVTKAKGEVS